MCVLRPLHPLCCAVQVRSVGLDTWLPEQVALLEAVGSNVAANAYWEARLGTTPRPAG
jgi:hypothetical protein